MDSLSFTIKKYRKSAGLTQQQVADAIGVKRSAYAYYEVGKSVPKLNALKKLALIYKTTVDGLIDNTEPIKNNLHANCDPVNEFAKNSGWEFNDGINMLSEYEQSVLLKVRLMSYDQKVELMNYLESLNK